MISVGAVCYHERVVPIWEDFKAYFEASGLAIDYVLYSNYERLAEALLSQEIDIGWNTNTAFVAVEQALGGKSQVLGMRDVDAEYASVVVTKNGLGFENPAELAGRRLALGSRDSGHAAILPLYYLAQLGLNLEKTELVRFDTDLGKHGDTGDSELKVLEAVSSGAADAGALGDAVWARLKSEGAPVVTGLKVSWKSPAYYHCNFTALESLDGAIADQWTKALLAMDYNDPANRKSMDLEGVKRWLPGDKAGYSDLTEAMQQQGYLVK